MLFFLIGEYAITVLTDIGPICLDRYPQVGLL